PARRQAERSASEQCLLIDVGEPVTVGRRRRSRKTLFWTRDQRESRYRPDRNRPCPPRARALSAFPRALFHASRTRVLRVAPESRGVVCGSFRRQGGGGQGARDRCRARVRV